MTDENKEMENKKTKSKLEKLQEQRERKLQQKMEEEAKKKQQSIADMDTPVDEIEIKVDSAIEKESPKVEEDKKEMESAEAIKESEPSNSTEQEYNLKFIANSLDEIKQRYGISEYNVDKKNHQVNIRLPKSLYDEFKGICQEMNASCNDTINKLIRDFVDQCKKDV